MAENIAASTTGGYQGGMCLPGAGSRLALGLALLSGGPGCVHAYQPLSGLHRPVVVDTQAPNFEDLRLEVRCLAGDLVRRAEAQMLCDKVGKLFENQGARVTTVTDRGMGDQDLGEDPDEAEGQAVAAPTTDLVMELRATRLHTTNNTLSWVFCLATATLVPAYTETTFSQDVVIRDGTGFLLVSDTLEGRLVRTFGLGTWAGNRLLDLVWREKEDELSDKAVHADVSKDLYGQLSQLVFNAKMRWQVLGEATPNGRATVPDTAVPDTAVPAPAVPQP